MPASAPLWRHGCAAARALTLISIAGLSSAIDEGERDAADEGQPAAAGKKKRKGGARKSSGARQFETR